MKLHAGQEKHMELQDKDHPQTESVLRIMNRANERLEYLLFNLENEPDAAGGIFEVARSVTRAADLNSDIALACILLNQSAGTYAVRHCIDTALVALLVARSLETGPNELLTMMAAALTMNLGMLRNQEQLQGRLGAISKEELALIHSHPQQGVEILQKAGIDDPDWLSFVLLHHENEDGSGYPFGKTGTDIPLCAKIISLSDRYCARVSSRNYRKSLSPDAALSDILLGDSNAIDPMLTTCFIRVLGTCPTGTLVRLDSNEIGVIAGKGAGSSTPIVHALCGPNGAPLPEPLRRDSSDKRFSIREILREEQVALRFTMQQVWGEAAQA